MKTIEKNIRKNGFDYRLVERTQTKAIYEQTDGADVVAYEVFIVHTAIAPAGWPNAGEEFERFPGNEDFGKTAWSCSSLCKAKHRYSKI